MRFAYADPPYLGLAEKFYKRLHPEAAAYDKPETHQALIDRLCSEFSDGWAMSLHTPSLRTILPMCPSSARVGAWVKPFAPFKPGVGVAYAWEPVIFMGGRKRSKREATSRDYCVANTILAKGFIGAKPATVVHWILGILNVQDTDEVVDIFPGSGAVAAAINDWQAASVGQMPGLLFAETVAEVMRKRSDEE